MSNSFRAPMSKQMEQWLADPRTRRIIQKALISKSREFVIDGKKYHFVSALKPDPKYIPQQKQEFDYAALSVILGIIASIELFYILFLKLPH